MKKQILILGLTLAYFAASAQALFDGSTTPTYTSNSPNYNVWHPLFIEGQTSYEQRMAFLNSITDPALQGSVIKAKAFVESKRGDIQQALLYANSLSGGDGCWKAESILGIYLDHNKTNEYVNWCTNYLALSSASQNGNSVVLVANRYCGYLILHGGTRAQVSDVAAKALKNSRISGCFYEAFQLYNRVQPSLFASPAEYKLWLATVIQNCDLQTASVNYLGKLKAQYTILP